MKNREEYRASIFAKRDALLAKRRRRISQSAAVMSIAVCFAVAFAFLPKSLDYKVSFTESYAESATFVSDSLTVAAPTTQESTALQEADETYTFYSSYIKYFGAKPHSQKGAAADTKPDVEELTRAATQIHLPNQETEIAQESEETTKRGFGGFRPEFWNTESFSTPEEDDFTPESSDYTTEEIIAEARKYLENSCSENTDSEDSYESEVTVTNTPSGSFYTVYFFYPKSTTKIKLDGETLELIDYSTERSENGKTQSTPAYIPTTAKPAMTTAAPEYRPQ